MSKKFFTILALSICSASLVQAYNGTSKYADKETKKNATRDTEKKQSGTQGKKEMKKIERELQKIQQMFQKNHDLTAAKQALDKMESRIEKAVASMKANEQHGRMWQVHQHTLQRKLHEVREYVKKHSKES